MVPVSENRTRNRMLKKHLKTGHKFVWFANGSGIGCPAFGCSLYVINGFPILPPKLCYNFLERLLT
jgi:hypothetical protein